MTTAKRLDGIGAYYFATKLREIDDLNRQGKEVISLARNFSCSITIGLSEAVQITFYTCGLKSTLRHPSNQA